MAYIYCADIYCDACGVRIKEEILTEHPEWESEFSDEGQYDSDEFPKYADDDEETDSPQHCGSGADCINAIELPGGEKIGCLIGTNLTAEGIGYVKEAVREGGLCSDLWRKEFDYINFDDDEDEDASND